MTTDCHRIAHIIGSASLLYFKGNVAQTYAHGSPSCTSGYYHGILERAFTNVFSTRGLIRVARSLCRDAGVRRRGFLDYQCDHGLGRQRQRPCIDKCKYAFARKHEAGAGETNEMRGGSDHNRQPE